MEMNLRCVHSLMAKHRAMKERSTPLCSKSMAVLCRKTCGETRLDFSDGFPFCVSGTPTAAASDVNEPPEMRPRLDGIPKNHHES